MTDLLTAALDEEKRLLQKLEAVRNLIHAYGGTSDRPNAGAQEKPPVKAPEGFIASQHRTTEVSQGPTRRPSEQTVKILEIARGLVAQGHGTPIPTRVLLKILHDHGMTVGGKDPVSTLSALLSHAEDFVANGRNGWTLKDVNQGPKGVTEDDLKAVGSIPPHASIIQQPTVLVAAPSLSTLQRLINMQKESGRGN